MRHSPKPNRNPKETQVGDFFVAANRWDVVKCATVQTDIEVDALVGSAPMREGSDDRPSCHQELERNNVSEVQNHETQN